jgi:hypothetical protein
MILRLINDRCHPHLVIHHRLRPMTQRCDTARADATSARLARLGTRHRSGKSLTIESFCVVILCVWLLSHSVLFRSL